MKKFFSSKLVAIMALAGASLSCIAQTYPVTSPSYVPNAVAAAATYTAPAAYAMAAQSLGTVTLRVTGTCTSLAAVAQASNDGTNFTTVNLYPIATGTTAPTAVASISAVGFWKINASGYSNLKLNITALTATCTVRMLGSGAAFNGISF